MLRWGLECSDIPVPRTVPRHGGKASMGFYVLCVSDLGIVLLAATREPHVKGNLVSVVLGRLGRATHPSVIHDETIHRLWDPRTTATLPHQHI